MTVSALRRHAPFAAFFLCSAAMPAMAADTAQHGLIPLPAQMSPLPGEPVMVGNGTRVVVPDHDGAALAAARYLAAEVAATKGLNLRIVPGAAVSQGDISIAMGKACQQGPEAYCLDVADGKIAIQGAEAAGLFYGGVTLWQLLTEEAGPGPVRLQPIHIADAPHFAWRGLMIDSARHMQSVAYLKRFIDWMALHKLNTFHWHLTDDQGWRLEIKRYPKLTEVGGWRQAVGPDLADPRTKNGRYGGVYTQAQVREIVAYAAARHITIVPEIDMPGHATAMIAAYPQLGVAGAGVEPVSSKTGLLPEVLNLDDATFTMIENILTEVMALFPGRYIHVGGDEADKTQWLASPAIQARKQALGLKDEDALERWFIARLGGFIEKHGRRLVGWDEILDGEAGSALGKDAVVMSWHGGTHAAQAAGAGHDVVVADSPTYYFNHRQANTLSEPPGWSRVMSLKDVYEKDPVPSSATPQEVGHLLGVQGQIWTERARTEDWVTQLMFPRAAALAETGWTGAGLRHWDQFQQRLAVQRVRYRMLGLKAGEEVPASAVADPLHKTGIELGLCPEASDGLVVEAQVADAQGAKLYKLDTRTACWVYPSVDLGRIARVNLAIGQIPFSYRLGSRKPTLKLPASKTAAGEMEIRLDRRDGALVGAVPLDGLSPTSAPKSFSVPLSGVTGTHRLFFVVTGPEIDPRQPGMRNLSVVERVDLTERESALPARVFFQPRT